MSSHTQEECDDVQTLSENSNSTEENTADVENIDDYVDEMILDTDGMETEGDELIVESQGEIEHEEEIIQTEEDIEPQEIEIHSEDRGIELEEVPERKYKSSSNMPPLRLLNIAPKPEQVPLAVKSVSGQPLILVPGAASGHAIKLVNPQGQEINLANYSLSRPITIKQGGKTTVSSTPVVQQTHHKQILMKKIITTSAGQKTITKPISFGKSGQQFVVLHKSGDQSQQIKLVQSTNATGISSATPVQSKTITLQQAQEMGLLGNAKILQSGVQLPTKRTVLINKAQPKTIKLVPQNASAQVLNNATNIKTISLGQVKSPTKILPAAVTSMAGAKGPQRIIFKSSGVNQVLPAGQLIQVAGSQGIANGQIHQIRVPGKGVQYIKFVTTTSAASAELSNSTVTLVNTVKTSVSPSVSSTSLSEIKPVITTNKIIAKPSSTTTKPTQVMLVPAGYVPTNIQQVQKVTIPPVKQPPPQPKQVLSTVPRPLAPVERSSPEPCPSPPTAITTTTTTTATTTVSNNENLQNMTNGIRPRKPCNCTKSQCLKLYCDCFANGEFCFLCNCMNCFNNLHNEDTRNLAIKACLERNPNAFRPKIGKAKDTTGDVLRKHTKGCNCKRSGCLKNYCECYEAKIACSSNCKCIGCRNIEDSIEKKSLEINSGTHRISEEELAQTVYRKILPYYKDIDSSSPGRPRKSSSRKQPITYITDEVIEATCQCLLTISDDADSNMQDEELTKRQIVEEFGGCLNEIIHCSINRNVS